jgi:uncharacterized damage-inducible protein DinB
MSLKSIVLRDIDLNHRVIHMQIDGLTHHDSLLQPPFRGNCLNWVLGHIVESRNTILNLLGGEPFWTPEQRARYARESKAVTENTGELTFEKIVSDLDSSQQQLVERIGNLEDEAFNHADKEGKSLGEKLTFLIWHETFHTGQTDQLRQLAGTNDKVI